MNRNFFSYALCAMPLLSICPRTSRTIAILFEVLTLTVHHSPVIAAAEEALEKVRSIQ
jgi:phospholipid N-methyltransferase